MSKPRRRSVAQQLGQEDDLADDNAVTLSRDDVTEEPPAEHDAPIIQPKAVATPVSRAKAALEPAARQPKRRSQNDNTRHTYHASLYLPEEAQFALREIALTMRRAKPHDVMLEAMAELFEKYNKGKLAKECRARIASRDKAVT